MPFERLIAERTWIRFFRWMRGHVSFHVARILERLEADRADKLLCWIMLLLDVCSQHLAILEIFSTFTATKNAPSIFLVLDEIFHVVKRTSTNVALNTMIFLGPHSKLVVPYGNKQWKNDHKRISMISMSISQFLTNNAYVYWHATNTQRRRLHMLCSCYKNVNRASPNIQILKILNPKRRKRPLE